MFTEQRPAPGVLCAVSQGRTVCYVEVTCTCSTGEASEQRSHLLEGREPEVERRVDPGLAGL